MATSPCMVQSSAAGTAAVAAAALIAAGADPQAPDGQGRLPVELALEPQCGPQCAELLRGLLGEAAEEAAASGAGPSKAAGQAAANGAGPSNSSRSGVQQVLKLAAAAIRQLAKGKRPAEPAQPAARECPVCLEPGACMTGPCGHLVCEGCATKDQVIMKCPVCCKKRKLKDFYKVFF